MSAQETTTTDKTTSAFDGNININAPYTPRYPTPVVSISINHPIATAVKKVKNFLTHKQTLFSSSFTIKVTPIVAIVSLFGVVGIFGGGITTAFTFGKTVEQKLLASVPKPTPKVIVITPTPAPVILSRSGTIKATYQLPLFQNTQNTQSVSNSDNQTFRQSDISDISGTPSVPISPTPTPKPTSTPTPPALHYILESRSGAITFLIAPSTVHLQNYSGLRVLITGSFNSIKNTLTISKAEDIEILQ